MEPKKTKLKNNRTKKKSFQTIAAKRIDELFANAEKLLEVDKKYADNCVKLARSLSLRYKVPFSLQQKLLFCKNCGSYLYPNKTSRVRISRGKIVILCLQCKHIRRHIYK